MALYIEKDIYDLAVKAVIAEAAKSQAKKRKVGAVIINNKNGDVVSSGYNHHPDNLPCELEDGSTDPKVVHAEIAALDDMLLTIDLADYIMFVSHEPCINCRTALEKASIPYVVVGEFLKFDAGKLRYDLIPPSSTKALAEVLTYGAKKYKPGNWKNVQEPERYVAAAMRHFEAYRAGEEKDKESNLSHLAHLLTNIAFLIELNYIPKG